MSLPGAPSQPACPQCAGPYLPAHPLGLTFRHRQACRLLAAEDARRAADVDYLRAHPGPLIRPVTPTERTLLAAVGTPLVEMRPDGSPPMTVVETVTDGAPLLRRRWDSDDYAEPAVTT